MLNVFNLNLPEYNPGENYGQMTMEYHGLPWKSMVIQPWSTMVDLATMFC